MITRLSSHFSRRGSTIGPTLGQTTHAIITGGSSGIGFALACLFAARGISVSILARTGGSQTVRVEHVHVNEGGQALIGNAKMQT